MSGTLLTDVYLLGLFWYISGYISGLDYIAQYYIEMKTFISADNVYYVNVLLFRF